MRGMLVGKPEGAVVLEPSETNVLLASSVPVAVGGGAVTVAAKVILVGIVSSVASSVPMGSLVYGGTVLVGEGVVKTEVSDPVAMGTTAVVDSSEDDARVSVEDALSTELVIADSAVPDSVAEADDPEEPEADETPVVVVEASDTPEVVEAVESSVDFVTLDPPDFVVAVESSVVAEAPLVVEDSAPDVGLPDPAVGVALSSDGVGIGTMGMRVVLSVLVAVSLELLERAVDGFNVGNSVDCSIAVADSFAVDDAPLEVGLAELPVPTELSVVPVETGTGIAVVPSVPVEVLRL